MSKNLNPIEDIRRTAEGLFFLLEEIDMNFGEMTEEKREALIGLAFEQSGKISSLVFREWLNQKEEKHG